MSREIVAPHNAEAERSVLGGLMMTNGKALAEVQDLLSESDFFLASHRVIYRAICELDLHERGADAVMVIDQLARTQDLESVGGREAIAQMISETPSASNIRAYAKIVRSFATRRALILASHEVYKLAAEDPRETDEVLAVAQQTILDVGKLDGEVGPQPLRKLIPTWYDKLDRMFHVEHTVTGIPTGFADLDQKINGLQRGQLIVIAGRPSMGKSALAFNILNNITNYKQLPGLAFSMEMSADEIVSRTVAQTGKVALDRLLAANLDDDHWPKISEAVERLQSSKMVLDESPALMLSQIRARARRMHQRFGQLGVVVVDYLQLLNGEERRGGRDNRAQELAEITRGLKALAKELNVPVVALSQLNRDVEKRDDKRPRLGDLRESGSIEQDADTILFVYRDVVYKPDTRFKNVAEIIIGKQRNGPVGTVLMHYFGEFTMFGQMAKDTQRDFWNERLGSKRERDDDAFDNHDPF